MDKKRRKPANLKAVNAQVRTWFLTINAHEDGGVPGVSVDQVEDSFREIDPEADWVFQLERGLQGGAQGYLHYQGVLLLSRSKPRRRQEVVRVLKAHGIPDAHLEKVRRVDAATRYCSKSETRQSGPWWSSENFHESSVQKAKASGSGAVGDRMLLADAVDSGMDPQEIALDERLRLLLTPANDTFVKRIWAAKNSQKWSSEQREVQVTFIYGPTGVGKTRFVREAVPPEKLYAAVLSSRDPFGMYRFQPVLLLDEFRDDCSLSYLLQLLDRYPIQLDRRYENLWAAWTKVFICSNWSIEDLYRDAPAADRAALRRRISKIIHMKGVDDGHSA